MKVVEQTGRTVKKMLQKSDPFRDKECKEKEKCMVCRNDEGTGQCRVTGVTYEIKCSMCDHVYVGETGRNAYSRGLEHQEGLNKKDEKVTPVAAHQQ